MVDWIRLFRLYSANPEGVKAVEAEGGREFVQLPILPKDADWEVLTAWGIVKGEEVDELFYACQLPEGWTKQIYSDEPRHSYLLDAKGRKRGSIFYKAAFYDRKAHMTVYRRYSCDQQQKCGCERSDYNSVARVGVVIDNGMDEVIWQTQPVPYPNPQTSQEWSVWHNALDGIHQQAQQWLNINYPDWEDYMVYWD